MGGNGFSILKASLFDLPAIWSLEQRCFPRDAYDIISLFGLAITPGMLRMKASVNQRLVAYAAGEMRRFQKVGWIITIGVLPDFEGRGIGRTLLQQMETKMLEQVTCLKLTVRRSNARAISLYDHCGYRWVSTACGYYSDGEDGLIMEKNLTLF